MVDCGLESRDFVPLCDVRLTSAAKAFGGLFESNSRQHPVAGSGLLHGDVIDDAFDAALLDDHTAVEELADDQCLG